MRQWIVGTTLVLDGTGADNRDHHAVIKQYGREYQVEHWIDAYTVHQRASRPTLLGAIRLAERWVT